MKNGNIEDFGVPSAEETELINGYTRRKFAPDELYAFSVVLCDNDIDRDFERFTDSALEKLAELFVGKTGIFDHSHKAENQCARVFSARVECENRKNRVGEQYKKLLARAYMPKSSLTDELILGIESGIKKEVSVGCSMGTSTCSVCGSPFGACQHKKGRSYRKDGIKKLCYFELSEPLDAYEWSFVAVPAQPKAGVVKIFGGSETVVINGIEKKLDGGEVVLTAEEAECLRYSFEELKTTADKAGEFLKRRKAMIIEMLAPDCTDEAERLLLKALESLESDELFRLYGEGKALTDEPRSQLFCKNDGKAEKASNEFFMV